MTGYRAKRWTPRGFCLGNWVGGDATTETEKIGHESRLQEGKGMMSGLGYVDFVPRTVTGT